MFGANIRAIVPQLAMSAGTMIACACNEIVMGAHSSLGPIDPQIGGMPAHGIIEEFTNARNEILADPRSAGIWQPIIAKYPPTLIGQCQKAIKWSEDMVTEWLKSGMFAASPNPSKAADKVVKALGTHALTLSHARHISLQKAPDLGLAVTPLEADNKLQDLVLTIHHACIHTLAQTPAIKIIENHNGVAFINSLQNVTIPQRQP